MGLLSTIGAASGRAFGLTRVGAAIRDAYFNLTTLLLPGNGTNGAQNNTFLDSSSNNFTITRNGNTTQGTFSPFSQTGWSNYFLNTGSQNLSAVTGADTSPGTGDFCAELWYFSTTTSGNYGLFGNIESNTDTQWGILLIQGSSLVRFQGWNTTFVSGTEPARNAWNHVAVCRSGTTMSMFINGTRAGTATVSNNFSATTNIRVGGPNGVDYFLGYISNARFVKGSSVYDPSQTTITVPTSPLTAITNTKFLTCQNNRFVDNSSTGYAITPNGSPSVQAFSPFAPTAAYSAATVGGSGYFDGSGDYLTIADNAAFDLGTADFTFECWVYKPDNTDVSFICSGATGLDFAYVSGSLRMGRYPVAWDVTQLYTIPQNAWTHIAFIKASGRTYLFANGTLLNAGGTANTNSYDTTTTFNVGVAGDGTRLLTGYMTGVRLIKGQALATANFTPPTAPVTTSAVGWIGAASSITGTVSLLLNYTNAGITDATAKNDLETVGNAQISTTQSKFGGSSMYFDGTGDYLVTPSSPVNTLGSGDFTVEFWAYPSNTSSAYRALVSSENYTGATGGWSIYQNGTSIEVWLTSGQVINATSALTATTWQHVALSRASGTVRLFVNGTSAGSASSSAEWTGQRIFIGDNNVSGTDYFFNGYLDDIRITRGFARYTANFTAPTSAFPLQ